MPAVTSRLLALTVTLMLVTACGVPPPAAQTTSASQACVTIARTMVGGIAEARAAADAAALQVEARALSLAAGVAPPQLTTLQAAVDGETNNTSGRSGAYSQWPFMTCSHGSPQVTEKCIVEANSEASRVMKETPPSADEAVGSVGPARVVKIDQERSSVTNRSEIIFATADHCVVAAVSGGVPRPGPVDDPQWRSCILRSNEWQRLSCG